jgi:hypothetical protein
MPKVNVILDLDQEFLMENKPIKHNKKSKKIQEKTIKIDDELFDLALEKGLIEKTEDGYCFIGEYKDLLAFKKKKNSKSINMLD